MPSRDSCELVCIDPRLVRKTWPRVSGLIYVAMRRGGLGSFAVVEEHVLAGEYLLWLALDRAEIVAAAVTCLEQTEWDKACVIVACAGEQMERWVGLLERIEGYARVERCAVTRIYGREGWARVLTTYRPKRVVLEKAL